MAQADEWLQFFYPNVFDGASRFYASPSEQQTALLIAENFRPSCLSDDMQNQAQAHYAAYILDFRRRANEVGLSADDVATAVVSGPIVEKQEGTTRVKYSEKLLGAGSSSVIAQMTGPGTPYAMWYSLWAQCSGVDVSSGEIVRRGGIISRYGLPK